MVEDREGGHGKPLSDARRRSPSSAATVAARSRSPSPRAREPHPIQTGPAIAWPMSRRRGRHPPAFGEALAALGAERPIRRARRRGATRPTRSFSPTRIPSGTSRCSSPSSRWSRPQSVCRSAAPSVRLYVRRVLLPGVRLHPDGGVSRARICLVGRTRASHRQRRPVPDGAGGPCHVAGGARQHGALPVDPNQAAALAR